MPDIALKPIDRPFAVTLEPPGSKSLSNRALVLAAMSEQACTLDNLLFADDTRVMLDGLKQLGFALEIDEPARRVVVNGCRGAIPTASAELFCGNSGTTIRFLAALCSLGRGQYRLDGVPRMRQRPIGELADALKNLGSRCSFPEQNGFPPLLITADTLPGGIIRYGSAASSQFLSAILMVSPFARHELQVLLDGEQTSWPYVWMTMQLMHDFGVTGELERDPATGKPLEITVPQGRYTLSQYTVEPDASNAMYFLAAAALHKGASVTIPALGSASLQGDVQFSNVLKRMGAQVKVDPHQITVTGTDQLTGIDVNLADMPDQAQTLGVLALYAEGDTTIRGLHTLRLKETDRLSALSAELQKCGAVVTVENNDTLIIEPPRTVQPAAVDTYDDHRMAMSFALTTTRTAGVTIRDAQCVNKTYPHFFQDLQKLH